MLGRRTARPPKPALRTKRGRMRGGRPSHRWSRVARWTIRQKRTTAKTTASCRRPPPAPPGRLASASRQTAKSCGVWLKTARQPKSCGSFRGGSSRWWRTRSRERGGAEEAAPEVWLPRRRPPWRGTPSESSTTPTKTTRRRAWTARPKRPLANLLRTRTPPRVRLCTRHLSEVTLRIRHPIFLRTCPCCEIFL